MIATGADDVLGSLKAIRAVSPATIVLKRGAMGCIVYDGPISDDLEDGIVGQGFPIEVFNVLGAGDAFMSGLLRGWLGGEPLEDGRHLGQCRRRLCRLAPELLTGISDLDRAAAIS
jgi:5-dehydro-2-deoxygluconokinase